MHHFKSDLISNIDHMRISGTEGSFTIFFNVCPFDYTAFAVSGKVGIPLIGLTTPVG